MVFSLLNPEKTIDQALSDKLSEKDYSRLLNHIGKKSFWMHYDTAKAKELIKGKKVVFPPEIIERIKNFGENKFDIYFDKTNPIKGREFFGDWLERISDNYVK